MNWRIKLKLLLAQGTPRDVAIEQLLDELAASNKDMDERLAKCMSFLSEEQMKEVFGIDED